MERLKSIAIIVLYIIIPLIMFASGAIGGIKARKNYDGGLLGKSFSQFAGGAGTFGLGVPISHWLLNGFPKDFQNPYVFSIGMGALILILFYFSLVKDIIDDISFWFWWNNRLNEEMKNTDGNK